MADITGKAKEKAGDTTGDKDLKREGQADQTADKVKGGVDKATDKLKGLLRKDK